MRQNDARRHWLGCWHGSFVEDDVTHVACTNIKNYNIILIINKFESSR